MIKLLKIIYDNKEQDVELMFDSKDSYRQFIVETEQKYDFNLKIFHRIGGRVLMYGKMTNALVKFLENEEELEDIDADESTVNELNLIGFDFL